MKHFKSSIELNKPSVINSPACNSNTKLSVWSYLIRLPRALRGWCRLRWLRFRILTTEYLQWIWLRFQLWKALR